MWNYKVSTCKQCGESRITRKDAIHRKWHTGMCRKCVSDSQKVRWIVAWKEIKEHSSWRSMISRCYNKNNKDYHRYGGSWITVYEWRRHGSKWFEEFLNYLWTSPTPQHSIDRIDNSKWYIPWNVRRATLSVQNSNKRNVTSYLGISAAGWSKGLGYNRTCIKYHMNRWKTLEDSIWLLASPYQMIYIKMLVH